MIESAVVLAAPVGATDDSIIGPITAIGGSSLIKRTLCALEQNDVQHAVIVGGNNDQSLRRHVEEELCVAPQLHWLEGVDGSETRLESLVRARQQAPQYTEGPTLVLDANLLFSPEIISAVAGPEISNGEGALIVDNEHRRVFDVDTSLKVCCDSSGLVQDLGASLGTYDGVAVGMGVITPNFFDHLERWAARSGSHMMAGLRDASRAGLLHARRISGSHWQRVDSEQTRLHAEWMIRAYGESLTEESGERLPSGADPQRTLSYIEGLLSEKRARHYVLLNPGPVLTSPRVKSALVHHDVCHRDDDCAQVVSRIERKLRRVCRGGPEHDILLLSGSGTAAMEATLASCVPRDGRLLIISNGAFGERFAEIASVHQLDIVHLRYQWGELVDSADVERMLREHSDIVAVVMCHHETSVGLLNPIGEVGAICHRLERMFFVDAVSSLGGEDVDVRRDQIDVLFSSANKCLHAISGVSFVCVNRRIWPIVEAIPPRGYYLDLRSYRKRRIPYTPAVSNLFALDAALDELLRDGVKERISRYRRLNCRIRSELSRMGLHPMTQTGYESSTITTWHVPERLSFDELYQALKGHGYIVYSCKASLKGRYFQVANMGNLTDEMVRGFLDAMDLVLRRAAQRRSSVTRYLRVVGDS